MKRLLLTLILLLTVSTEGTSGEVGPVAPGLRINPAIASVLQLSEAQAARIEALRHAFREEMDPLRERLLGRRLELNELWARSPLDHQAIRQKQWEIQVIQSDMQDRITRHQLECRRLLTPEQQEKLAAMLNRHHGDHGPQPDAVPAPVTPGQ